MNCNPIWLHSKWYIKIQCNCFINKQADQGILYIEICNSSFIQCSYCVSGHMWCLQQLSELQCVGNKTTCLLGPRIACIISSYFDQLHIENYDYWINNWWMNALRQAIPIIMSQWLRSRIRHKRGDWDRFISAYAWDSLSITFNSDVCICTHTRQVVHDTKMSDIDILTVMFDVSWSWCHWSLDRRYTLLRIANKRYDVTDKGTCNFAARPYLDDDGVTTCHTLVSR